LITSLSPEMAVSRTDMVSSLSRIILQGMVLPLSNCCFRNKVTLLSWIVPIEFCLCSYQFSLPNFTYFPLCMVECICVMPIRHVSSKF
jgi:hypothetical protein